MSTRGRARLFFSFVAAGSLMLAVAVPAVVAANKSVAIRDFAFSPRTVEIRVGDSVRWTNHDCLEHSATARNGSFDTGLLGEGHSRAVRFTALGTYRYVCTPHPTITGTVVVRAASTGGIEPPNTDTGTSAAAASGSGAPLAALVVVGGIGLLVAMRAPQRRRETA